MQTFSILVMTKGVIHEIFEEHIFDILRLISALFLISYNKSIKCNFKSFKCLASEVRLCQDQFEKYNFEKKAFKMNLSIVVSGFCGNLFRGDEFLIYTTDSSSYRRSFCIHMDQKNERKQNQIESSPNLRSLILTSLEILKINE